MSWFTNYLNGRRKQGNPLQVIPMAVPVRNDGAGSDGTNGSAGSGVNESSVVDSNNAIGSLSELLGPSPVEREMRERRALQHKSAMSAWAGLFDGLRQLGNLYYTSKGASPQAYGNPYAQIDRDVEANRKRMDDLDNYRRQYNMQLYGLQRQGEQDRMNAEQHKAQLANLAANNELLKTRIDSERVRSERDAALKQARTDQIRLKTQQMQDLHPLQRQKLEQTIRKLMHDAGRPYSGSTSSSSDVFEDLAALLVDHPEVIGPILQQQGVGDYDSTTGQFEFDKQPTKNAAALAVGQANRRTGGRRSVMVSGNTMPGVRSSDNTMPGVNN